MLMKCVHETYTFISGHLLKPFHVNDTELQVAITYFEESILSIVVSTLLFKLSQVNNFQGKFWFKILQEICEKCGH